MKKKAEEILVLTCGGTFDKSKFTKEGKFVPGETLATGMLDIAQVDDIKVQSVMKKDSLEMDNLDRQILLKAALDAKHKKIIVIHGTDTMVDSALHMQKGLKNKVVVFTGAMTPAIFKESDAGFNLGYAFGIINSLKNGIYIAMHGRYYLADQVLKNRDLMKFEVKI